MITPLAAAKAYAATQQTVAAEASLGASAPGGTGGGFGEILKSAMSDAVKTSHNAETQMAAQVQGKADLVDVATAVSSAEASLETVMAIRDQVINAYQEIMHMPI
ncbi:MAG TPA: flagellar hook-basal body complex protein FliE [Phenylobacterium sp.]|jgi:flagellar hook-basal body complex protein FliE|nr:flagellar hook-basal body complex protein FliE [Phenylobacterium sp.]